MPWLLSTVSHPSVWFAAFSWIVAVIWLARLLPAYWMLPGLANLLDTSYKNSQEGFALPSIGVVVPAKNEAASIEDSLRSLLASNYSRLTIVAVNDRSTDATGAIMERIAAEPDVHGRLQVLHVTELPDGWLGKPHAMALAAGKLQSDWLVFTDADVLFAPDTLLRAVNYASKSNADHLVIIPTLVLRGWAENMLIAFLQCVTALASRPWKVADPKSVRDYIGVGAFNMIRKPIYDALDGYASLRMEVLEDLRMGLMVKRAGFAQRVAFGKDLLRIRWAESAWGLIDNFSKNMFAAFRFRSALLLVTCVTLVLLCVTPFVALAVPGPARWAGVAALTAILLTGLRYWPQTRVSPVYLALFPLAALVFVWTLLRSMVLVLWRGGVLWRGTLYPLKELRRHAGTLW